MLLNAGATNDRRFKSVLKQSQKGSLKPSFGQERQERARRAVGALSSRQGQEMEFERRTGRRRNDAQRIGRSAEQRRDAGRTAIVMEEELEGGRRGACRVVF